MATMRTFDAWNTVVHELQLERDELQAQKTQLTTAQLSQWTRIEHALEMLRRIWGES